MEADILFSRLARALARVASRRIDRSGVPVLAAVFAVKRWLIKVAKLATLSATAPGCTVLCLRMHGLPLGDQLRALRGRHIAADQVFADFEEVFFAAATRRPVEPLSFRVGTAEPPTRYSRAWNRAPDFKPPFGT
jgi:hypothetical protein